MRAPKRAVTSDSVNVVVDSLTLKVTVVVEPDVNDVEIALMETVGAPVSYEMLNVLDAVLLLPAVSVNRAPATEMEPVPDCVLADGVKVAEYEVPLPEKPLMAPPVTVISVEMKFVEDSESVKVIVSESPDFRVPEPERVIETVGTTVS